MFGMFSGVVPVFTLSFGVYLGTISVYTVHASGLPAFSFLRWVQKGVLYISSWVQVNFCYNFHTLASYSRMQITTKWKQNKISGNHFFSRFLGVWKFAKFGVSKFKCVYCNCIIWHQLVSQTGVNSNAEPIRKFAAQFNFGMSNSNFVNYKLNIWHGQCNWCLLMTTFWMHMRHDKHL